MPVDWASATDLSTVPIVEVLVRSRLQKSIFFCTEYFWLSIVVVTLWGGSILLNGQTQR